MCENTKEMTSHQCNKQCAEKHTYEDAKTCSGCYISTENSSHTRRCFMTGEYCSQKTNIQHERKKLYSQSNGGITISAFVIMNFSDMADVVYKWRVEVFVESIKKYLFFNEENNRLYCYTDGEPISGGDNLLRVNKINVIRADSDPASNYIICSRICQQMQIADLIIVDVSSQNPNVFYEFGMAVSLDKLVLPICFSESFYKLEVPEKLRKIKLENGDDYKKADEDKAFNHMGCYPWRKRLFEYYGIRYKQNGTEEENTKEASTFYIPFDKAKNEKYGFSDIQYARFPYDENIDDPDETVKQLGEKIYTDLSKSYNASTKWQNTLVVYTIEGFLNEDQAGRCIVNFYHSITEKMRKEKCFQGERVGVLVQDQVIPDSDKDSKQERHLLYNVGEIIHIGVNQATYLASKEKVLAEDVLPKLEEERKLQPEFTLRDDQKKELRPRIKEFIGNRGMIIYPDYPIYVKRITNKTTPDILESEEEKTGCSIADFFCLYHVMLRNLRYTNEIVVDITNNCLQSLFWLGAAHGSEVDAITVKQVLSEKERIIIEGSANDNNRNVFDVSGLWTAYYYSHDTEGFYHQLALAQFGIEKHSKIIPADAKWHGFKKWEYLKLHVSDEDEEDSQENAEVEFREKKAKEDAKKKNKLALESYYRRRFWNAMLRYNRLRIYLPQHDDVDREDKEPRLRAAKWDMDAVSGLTHYLSKRAVIGEYLAIAMPESAMDPVAKDVNFICIGQPVKPLGKTLAEDISGKIEVESKSNEENVNIVHRYYIKKGDTITYKDSSKIDLQVKGFNCKEQENVVNKELVRYHPWSACERCKNNEESRGYGILDQYPLSDKQENCPFIENSSHTEIAQLILWREDGEMKGNRHFQVSLIGSSGPATFGLSSLFVDEGQKLVDFLKENKSGKQDRKEQDNCLLYELQEKVRKKICTIVRKKLKNEIKNIIAPTGDLTEKQNNYIVLVLYTVHSYLSTVLYRYFLPFLTEKDIHRIESGITMFVNTMKASRQSPFCLDYRSETARGDAGSAIDNEHIENIVKLIPEQIIQIIESFRGLEVFYEVEVTHRNAENNSFDAEKQEIQGSNDSKIEALCDESHEDSNSGSPEQTVMYCKRNEFTSDNQRDNRTVSSIKMMDEINYFILGSSQ